MLSDAQIQGFIRDGFVRVDRAFPREVADAARAILWRDLPCRPDDATTWSSPVVRLGMYSQEPFVQAANTPALHEAFDQLVGAGRWLPCRSMGTFPVRFPSPQDPGDGERFRSVRVSGARPVRQRRPSPRPRRDGPRGATRAAQ